MNEQTTPTTPQRIYFATANFHRAWGEYLFLAECRQNTWRLFAWSEQGWQSMDLMDFNVIHAAKLPRIVIAEEAEVEAIAKGASATETNWQRGRVDNLVDWAVLMRGYLDEEDRRAALEAMVESGDVWFTTPEGEEDTSLTESDKVSMLDETVTDADILDSHDLSELRLRYLLPTRRVEPARANERVS